MREDMYGDMPDEPDLAFIYLEDFYRTELNKGLSNAADDSRLYHDLYLTYMNKTVSAARTLDLSLLASYETSRPVRDIYDQYKAFSLEVDGFIVRTNIKYGKRRKKYSVLIEASKKESIRDYLKKIKTIVDGTDIPSRKREALHERINAFELELERDRTRYEVIMDLVLETSDTIGQASDKLNPLRKILDSITGLVKSAKDTEASTKQISPPSEPKRLDPPQKSAPEGYDRTTSPEEDIPF